MCFLYMFDLLDFDSQGKVRASKGASLEKAQSNFLYLVSKFNQNLLKEKGLPVPAFFKEELSSVLEGVEKGWDFDVAKKKVFSECLPQISLLSNRSDKEVISALVESSSVADMDFAEKFKDIKNHLQLEYIMTITSGKVFNKVDALREEEMTKENKSKLFKEVIKYNSLVCAAERVRENGVFGVQSVGAIG